MASRGPLAALPAVVIQGLIYASFEPQTVLNPQCRQYGVAFAVPVYELSPSGLVFHVHTNPFQIIDRNGQPEPYPVWKDTVLVPAGETIRIRTRFDTFTGKSLYHCHILDHEDLGMAGILNIQA